MERSEALYKEASKRIPGGVNSPVRAFRGVGGTPIFFKRGEGAYVIDEDDRRLIDYVGSWGPLIVGHAHPDVIGPVKEAVGSGLGFGAPSTLETEMAEQVCRMVPSIEMVRMVNSGTEATMSAVRVARGHTGRDKIIKFEGNFHGHVDGLLVKAGSGALTLGVPSSLGVPASYTEQTIVCTYNDVDSVAAAFEQHGKDIAGIIVEPVAGNMNCIPPEPGFLEGLRQLCDDYGACLIFDEVMTGFRVARGGAQEYYGISPDLTCLGKVLGGGMPVGAYGGRREIMDQVAPVGPVYQSGTLAGNPIAMTAGLATLRLVDQPGFHDELARKSERLTDGILAAAREAGIPMTANRVGGMFGLFFTDRERVFRYDHVAACDLERFGRFFHAMVDEGVYLAPAAFEAGFVSSAHTDGIIDQTITAAERVFTRLSDS